MGNRRVAVCVLSFAAKCASAMLGSGMIIDVRAACIRITTAVCTVSVNACTCTTTDVYTVWRSMKGEYMYSQCCTYGLSNCV